MTRFSIFAIAGFAIFDLSPKLVAQSMILRQPTQVDRRNDYFRQFPEKFIKAFRKYGEYDFKQHSCIYTASTGYIFGAAGAKAGFPNDAIFGLARVAIPAPDDITLMKSLNLKATFAAKRKELDELLTMANEDSHLARISNEYTEVGEHSNWPKDKERISESRWKSYKDRFKDIGLSEGIVRNADYPDAVFFIVHSEGLSVAGAGCGYVYSTKALTPLSEDPIAELNKLARDNPKSSCVSVFQPLGGNWYLFYELDW